MGGPQSKRVSHFALRAWEKWWLKKYPIPNSNRARWRGSKFSKLVCGVARPIFHMIGANEQCSFSSKGVEDARGSEVAGAAHRLFMGTNEIKKNHNLKCEVKYQADFNCGDQNFGQNVERCS